MKKELLCALDLVSYQHEELNNMRSKSIMFNKIIDCEPKQSSIICFIKVNRFYGDYEFRFGRVDYYYEEVGPDDEFTGTTYCQEPSINKINYKKYIVVNDTNLTDNTLWCYADSIDDLLKSSGALED